MNFTQRKSRDLEWEVLEPGTMTPIAGGSMWGAAMTAVLMDIRDELKGLNRRAKDLLLDNHRILRTLSDIRRNTQPKGYLPMPTKKLDTAAKLALSNRRAGARRVRTAITEKINDLLPSYPTGDGRTVLDELGNYIAAMIDRDKKRAGGLWN